MESMVDRSVHPLYAVMAFVCAVSVILIFARIRINKTNNNEKKSLNAILKWVIFFCLQDGIWGLFAAHIIKSDILLFITSTIFHFSSAMSTFVWVIYFLSTLTKIKRPAFFKIITGALVLVQICMLVANFFTRFMFDIDADGYYVSTDYRRILFYLQFAVYIITGILSLSRIIRERKGHNRNFIVVFCVNLSPIVFGFFQMLYPDAPANSIGFSISCLLIYTFIVTELEHQVEELKAREEMQIIIERQNEELVAKEQSLLAALEMAENANESKSRFLFNMSHDIRTPMNAIIGYTEMALRHTDDSNPVRDSLTKIKTSSSFLLSIINDVLDMARIEYGKIDLEESIVNTSEINESLTQMIQVNAKAKGITVHSANQDVTDMYVWADKNRVNQIVSNLLSNAVKYTNDGGEIWHIVKQIPYDKAGFGKYQTIVKDNGVGMSPEFLEKVFDEFEREGDEKTNKVQGTGLGMSIVKKLVDMMNGTIEISSEKNKGTTVIVTLIHRIATKEEIEEYEKKSNDVHDEDYDVFKGKKILLVEDNEMNREIAMDILGDYGMSVDTAEDGTVAMEKMRNAVYGQYDLVLMDIQMPKLNGYEATKMIRNLDDPRIAGIPIIAMTANAFEEDRNEAIEAGMNEHIAKPIDIKKMSDTLKKYLL